MVSVVGLVGKPGLVTLEPGARIADALTAAGGPLDGADLLDLNMARRLANGEQVVVGIAPVPGEPATMGGSVSPGQSPATSRRLRLRETPRHRTAWWTSTAPPRSNWTPFPGSAR